VSKIKRYLAKRKQKLIQDIIHWFLMRATLDEMGIYFKMIPLYTKMELHEEYPPSWLKGQELLDKRILI
jgi:hypothetical protein